jgi:hypothetical protein
MPDNQADAGNDQLLLLTATDRVEAFSDGIFEQCQPRTPVAALPEE